MKMNKTWKISDCSEAIDDTDTTVWGNQTPTSILITYAIYNNNQTWDRNNRNHTEREYSYSNKFAKIQIRNKYYACVAC